MRMAGNVLSSNMIVKRWMTVTKNGIYRLKNNSWVRACAFGGQDDSGPVRVPWLTQFSSLVLMLETLVKYINACIIYFSILRFDFLILPFSSLPTDQSFFRFCCLISDVSFVEQYKSFPFTSPKLF